MTDECIYDGEVHPIRNNFYYITKKSNADLSLEEAISIANDFLGKVLTFCSKNNFKLINMQYVFKPAWLLSCLAQHSFFSIKFQVEPMQSQQSANFNESRLNDLRELRESYDNAIQNCFDPITYMARQQQLIYDIVEHLIKPLQEYEMAQRSKLRIDESVKEED